MSEKKYSQRRAFRKFKGKKKMKGIVCSLKMEGVSWSAIFLAEIKTILVTLHFKCCCTLAVSGIKVTTLGHGSILALELELVKASIALIVKIEWHCILMKSFEEALVSQYKHCCCFW